MPRSFARHRQNPRTAGHVPILMLLAGALVGGGSTVRAAEATAPFGFAFPQNLAAYRMTSAFDLDRSTGRADWTGWKAGDPTPGNGHAYDNHSGTDFGMSNGTALHAVADGRVTAMLQTFPRNDTSGGGNYMIFSHTVQGTTFTANFWHLDHMGALKNVGERVTKGEHVAWSNNTGNSTGPHLHYGIRRDVSSSGTGLYSCPFYHAWWEGDEFYYGDTRPCLVYVRVAPGIGALNCREGNSTAYDVVTTLPAGAAFVASQRNGWWRIFLPLPPARALESRDAAGDLATGYTETGDWYDDAGKSSVADAAGDPNRVVLEGAGSRYSEFVGTGGAETARFTFTLAQKGEADLYATYPRRANARDVTYRIAHAGGTTDVVQDQRGGDASFVNRWVLLGRFSFGRNVSHWIEIRQSGVSGPIDPSRPGRVYADAVKIVPVVTHRSGFCSDDTALSARIDTSSEPVGSVVFDQDRLAGNDSRDLADAAEFPIYAAPGSGGVNASPIVAKAVTGQRLVCTSRTAGGWYRVHLTNGTSARAGWVSGDHVRIYNPKAAPLVPGGFYSLY